MTNQNLTPGTVISVPCGQCAGRGYLPGRMRPGHKTPHIECYGCHGAKTFSRTVRDQAELMLAEEPPYCARRDAMPMAEWAIGFVQRNPWADIVEALYVAYQCAEFHAATRSRYARAKLRQDAGQSWRGLHLGRTSSARDRMLVLVRHKGYSGIADYAAARYRAGTFATASTLHSVMTSTDMAAMQYRIGLHAVIGGIDAPYFPRLLA